ncbi:mitochondrial substrate carrier family protein ucpB-like [Saccoglossus kowalevskii]|uniref:Mitochondrial substrate carrier family protein ucpB-like n=1 Tax=Saccoglossus kowalevskii TaxID=10224 RepID=A0ABM0GZY4_SACKO|nr:PREDICTED: mitochondrial substrate carrier family protein ucpB-like [Saccoglossus kowalevskii]
MASSQPESEAVRYALAGVSCMCAAFATNPIDVVKIRMQLEGELAAQKGKGVAVLKNRYYDGFIKGGIKVVQDEGIRGLYKGVLPSLLREGTYSTIRIGAYEPIKVWLGATDPAHTPLYKKILAGATSGAIGSSIATPTDLIKVRMQAEGKLVSGQTKRYNNTYSAFADIARHEGLRGLYRGAGPTINRAAILTATQVPSYDHSKHFILNTGLMKEGPVLHIVSSVFAGFMAAVTTSPVDVIKTRIMSQQIKGIAKGEHRYRNSLDCFIKTLQSEGLFGFYKGFIPNWIRIGPHTIISFFLFEYFRKLVGIKPI